MLRIHVVNSIKGGCGKSTICLLLADYLNQQGLSPLIIDIDLCGTSWYKNYEKFLDENFSKENYCFINDLIENFTESLKGRYIANIKTKYDAIPVKDIKICMADPERNTHIEEVELDLFENAIYKLIMDCCAEKGKMKTENGVPEDIDVILDMPPGYEAHAERIVNHLLLDVNSPLYRKIKEDDINYRILLYMVTGLSDSGIKFNIEYVKKLVLNQSISSDVSTCLKKNNILFILNDSTHKLEQNEGSNLATMIDNIGEHKINSELNNAFENNNEDKITIKFLEHISIKRDITSFFGPLDFTTENTVDYINISKEERSASEKLFSPFSLSIKKNSDDKK